MKIDLQSKLDQYTDTLNQFTREVQDAGKTGLAGTAALAAIMTVPVELNAQVVCGDLGAPTVSTGTCIGGAQNLGDYYAGQAGYCLKLDFDNDGTDELQVRYYNYSGYPAYAYVDPISISMATLNKGPYATLYGVNFPENPTVKNLPLNRFNQDRIYVVPLSGGGGYGFITIDSDFYPFLSNGGVHPVTGQLICCTPYGKITMWGAVTGINSFAAPELEIQSDDVDECPGRPLPVELTAFTARSADKSIQLSWQTASETANAGFEVQRSTDGVNFQPLGFVNGQGDVTETSDYTFEDQNADTDTEYFYRLKQIDFDGTFSYSPIVTAQLIGQGLRATVFPNPAVGGMVNFSVKTAFTGSLRMTAYNGAGQVILTADKPVQAGSNSIELDMSGVASGLYFLKLEQDGETAYEKVVVR